MDKYQNILKSLCQSWQQLMTLKLTDSQCKDALDLLTDQLKKLFVFTNSCQISQRNNSVSNSIQNNINFAHDNEWVDTECYFENPKNKDSEKWCNVTEAAKKAGRDRGVISRWAKDRKIHSTTIAGRKKLIYFPDVLYMNFKAEQKKLNKDFEEYRADVQEIPDEH